MDTEEIERMAKETAEMQTALMRSFFTPKVIGALLGVLLLNLAALVVAIVVVVWVLRALGVIT